jgi:hypothetical protein
MPNTLTITSAIAIPNVKRAQILGTVGIDEGASVMSVPVQLQGVGGTPIFDTPFVLQIGNGFADALVANAAAVSHLGSVVSVRLGGSGVAAAFTTALAAYHSAGADKRGNLLTALLGITGTVQAGAPAALVGTTQPILPAGAVS